MVVSEPFGRTDVRTPTGKFRLGNDQLLVDATGQSKISVQDYAVAMIDELERPAHVGRRFTAGY
jgi:uncharacterized protein